MIWKIRWKDEVRWIHIFLFVVIWREFQKHIRSQYCTLLLSSQVFDVSLEISEFFSEKVKFINESAYFHCICYCQQPVEGTLTAGEAEVDVVDVGEAGEGIITDTKFNEAVEGVVAVAEAVVGAATACESGEGVVAPSEIGQADEGAVTASREAFSQGFHQQVAG